MVQTPDTINSLQRFHILGSSETNPAAGIISYQSPLGAALLGHAVGETITLKIGLSTKLFTIKHIA
jgi:transcription elongation GreA/GreB family factor